MTDPVADGPTPAPAETETKPGWGRRLWLNWIKPIVWVLLILGTFRGVIADWNDVPTGSMRPTIEPGDRIVVNKLAYQLNVPLFGWHLWEWASPQRGDIVVCYSPENGDRLVKRLVAVPGDTVELRQNDLYINGQLASYAWNGSDNAGPPSAGDPWRIRQGQETMAGRTHAVLLIPQPGARWDFGPVKLGPGQYFAMGDNRNQSKDSRYFGVVTRDRIVGRAFAVAVSLDHDHNYMPRWGRFFLGLH